MGRSVIARHRRRYPLGFISKRYLMDRKDLSGKNLTVFPAPVKEIFKIELSFLGIKLNHMQKAEVFIEERVQRAKI